MANRGEITEIVNAQKLTLEVGADTYILLQNLTLHVGRPEAREPTTDGGVLYYYGKGEHYFEADLLVSTPEIAAFNTLTQLDADGEMTTTAYKIVAQNISGATSTVTVNAVLNDFNTEKPTEGGVLFHCRFRIIDDTVTVT